MMNYVSVALLVLGLLLTAGGAALAAWGVFLTESNATELASQKWDLNVELRDALLNQSRKAMWGLISVAIGTAFQIVGTIIPLWPA
jgi:hypothetical protein